MTELAQCPRKICILGNAQNSHVVRWVEYFLSRGHEVVVVSVRPATLPGATVIAQPIPFARFLLRKTTYERDRSQTFGVYLGYFLLALRIRRLLRQIKPEFVMAFTLETNGVLAWLSGFHPTSIHHLGEKALTVRSETSLLIRFLVKRVMHFGDIFQTGDTLGKQRHVELGAEAGKVVINYWGIEPSVFSPQLRCPNLRADLASDAEHVFLAIRSLIPEYHVDIFLRAIAEFRASNQTARFVIVGDGPELPRLRALAEELKIADVTRFVGYLPFDELARYLATADFYVETVQCRFPTGRTWWGHRINASASGNPFSQTGTMALASGCIPIPAHRPGIETFLPTSLHNLTWPADSATQLADRMMQACSIGPQQREMLATEASQFARQHFNWSRNVRELEATLLQLCDHPSYADATP